MKKLIVKREFVDRDNFDKKYRVGDVVEFDDEKRIESLTGRGLCEVAEGENKDDDKAGAKINIFDRDYEKKEILAALKACDVKVVQNISSVKLIEKINELGEETIAKLQKALETGNP